VKAVGRAARQLRKVKSSLTDMGGEQEANSEENISEGTSHVAGLRSQGIYP
jgi:hypothetical protein